MAGALFTVDYDLSEIRFVNIKRLIRMELFKRKKDVGDNWLHPSWKSPKGRFVLLTTGSCLPVHGAQFGHRVLTPVAGCC
jgi:hypothetical protein